MVASAEAFPASLCRDPLAEERRGEEKPEGTLLHCDSVLSTFPPAALALLSPPSPGPFSCRGLWLIVPPAVRDSDPLTPALTPGVLISATAWGK